MSGIPGVLCQPLSIKIFESSPRDLLTTKSDQESFPMKTYVINVPDVGPYVVMVRPGAEEAETQEGAQSEDETRQSRPVFPGTEGSFNVDQEGMDEEEDMEKETSPRDSQSRIEIVPFKKLHFFKS